MRIICIYSCAVNYIDIITKNQMRTAENSLLKPAE